MTTAATVPAAEVQELTLAQKVEKYEAAKRDLFNIRKTVQLAKRALSASMMEIVAHMERDLKQPEETFTLPSEP